MGDVPTFSRRFLIQSALGASAACAFPAVSAHASELDAQSAALNELLAGEGVKPLHLQSVKQVRASFEEAAKMMPGPTEGIVGVEDSKTLDLENPVSVRLYRPAPSPDGSLPPILVYMHGGYFVAGSIETHDHVARRLCAATGALVASVEYRLAPEHPYPAAIEDGAAVMRWLSARGRLNGGDPSRIGLCGDNAGAAIAAKVAMSVRLGVPGFKFLGLFSPILMLSYDYDFESRAEFGQGGYRPSLKDLDWMIRNYGGGLEDIRRISPMATESLEGLPKTLVVVAGNDAFRDEAEFFVRRLREDRVPTGRRVFPTTIHDFLYYPEIVPAARSAYDVIGAQFRVAMGG